MNRETIRSCALRVQQLIIDNVKGEQVETQLIPPVTNELGAEHTVIFIWAAKHRGMANKKNLNVTVNVTRKITDELPTCTVMSAAGARLGHRRLSTVLTG
jgi:hypothetical protein